MPSSTYVKYQTIAHAANKAMPNVLAGTPVTPLLPTNTFVFFNSEQDGDLAIVINKGGNSQAVFWADASAGDTAVMASSGASVDHYIAGTKVLDHASGAFAFQESTTLSSTGTLTINAFTLGGNITGNSKAITGVTYIELTTDPQVRLNVDNSFLRVSGGTDANAAGVVFHGKNSGTAGMMELFSTRADGVTVKRLEFTGGVATSVATWSNITHTGIVLSGALNANAQQITNSSIISMEAGAGLYSNVGAETSAMYIRGGPWASGGGGMLVVYGHAHASTPGALELTTTNAAGTGEVRRVIFSGAVGTAIATWSDITHTGFDLGTATAAFGSGAISYTGTLAVTGSRVTQSYHTNITSTNAVTVDSSIESKIQETMRPYRGNALDVIAGMEFVEFQHHHYLDHSDKFKLGVVAESIGEHLVLSDIEKPGGGYYPGVNLYALDVLNAKGIQEAHSKIQEMEREITELKAQIRR